MGIFVGIRVTMSKPKAGVAFLVRFGLLIICASNYCIDKKPKVGINDQQSKKWQQYQLPGLVAVMPVIHSFP
jgi:hypothetical protein